MVPGTDFWGTNVSLFVGFLSWNDFGATLETKSFADAFGTPFADFLKNSETDFSIPLTQLTHEGGQI